MAHSEQTKAAIRDHLDKTFVCEANGHTIRKYARLTGDCYTVGGQGFETPEQALEWAERNPK